MRNTKQIVLWVVAIAALVLGVLSLIRPNPVQTVVERVIGATPGSSIDGNEWCVGGVCEYRFSKGFAKGTSTICVLGPISATSTLRHFSANFKSSTSTTVQVILSTSTKPYARGITTATSSLITTATIDANTAGVTGTGFLWIAPSLFSKAADSAELTPFFDATTTAQRSIVRSGEYLIFNAQGGGVSNDSFSGNVWTLGTCNASLLAY